MTQRNVEMKGKAHRHGWEEFCAIESSMFIQQCVHNTVHSQIVFSLSVKTQKTLLKQISVSVTECHMCAFTYVSPCHFYRCVPVDIAEKP